MKNLSGGRLEPGQKVVWIKNKTCETYCVEIPAVVVQVAKQNVRIQILNGGELITKFVAAHSLRIVR